MWMVNGLVLTFSSSFGQPCGHFFPFFCVCVCVWFSVCLCTGEVSKLSLSHCSHPLACLGTWYTSVMERSHCLPLTLSSYAVILHLMLHQWPNIHMVSHCLHMQSFFTWCYISDWTLTWSHTVLCSHSILDTTSVIEHSHHLALSYAVVLYVTLH